MVVVIGVVVNFVYFLIVGVVIDFKVVVNVNFFYGVDFYYGGG